MKQKRSVWHNVAKGPIYLSLSAVIVLSSFLPAGAILGKSQVPDFSLKSAPDTLLIQVTLSEFSIKRDPLRLPAGRPIRLVITNVGVVDHEFMVGRFVNGGDFDQDLFSGVSIQVSSEIRGEEAAGEHGNAGRTYREHSAGNEDHAAGENGPHESAERGGSASAMGEHGEGMIQAHFGLSGGHGHGTMVLMKPTRTTTMTFTLPTSKRGYWETACFLPGHFEAGMHGELIVE